MLGKFVYLKDINLKTPIQVCDMSFLASWVVQGTNPFADISKALGVFCQTLSYNRPQPNMAPSSDVRKASGFLQDRSTGANYCPIRGVPTAD